MVKTERKAMVRSESSEKVTFLRSTVTFTHACRRCSTGRAARVNIRSARVFEKLITTQTMGLLRFVLPGEPSIRAKGLRRYAEHGRSRGSVAGSIDGRARRESPRPYRPLGRPVSQLVAINNHGVMGMPKTVSPYPSSASSPFHSAGRLNQVSRLHCAGDELVSV
jgi:hypothetical protein